jgi:hypothetical protein
MEYIHPLPLAVVEAGGAGASLAGWWWTVAAAEALEEVHREPLTDRKALSGRWKTCL